MRRRPARKRCDEARRLHPQVVLVDVVLPDLDGFAVCERLAESEASPTVVLTSSRDAAAYRQRIRDSAARGFIAKRDLTGATLAALLGLRRWRCATSLSSPAPPRWRSPRSIASHDPGDNTRPARGRCRRRLRAPLRRPHCPRQKRPASRIGVLMGLAGFGWFAGSFWSGAAFLHRGPLVHLHASYPTGRLRWWPAVATVVIAYVARVDPIAGNDWATLAMSALVATVATANYLRSSGTARRAGRPALLAGLGIRRRPRPGGDQPSRRLAGRPRGLVGVLRRRRRSSRHAPRRSGTSPLGRRCRDRPRHRPRRSRGNRHSSRHHRPGARRPDADPGVLATERAAIRR